MKTITTITIIAAVLFAAACGSRDRSNTSAVAEQNETPVTEETVASTTTTTVPVSKCVTQKQAIKSWLAGFLFIDEPGDRWRTDTLAPLDVSLLPSLTREGTLKDDEDLCLLVGHISWSLYSGGRDELQKSGVVCINSDTAYVSAGGLGADTEDHAYDCLIGLRAG